MSAGALPATRTARARCPGRCSPSRLSSADPHLPGPCALLVRRFFFAWRCFHQVKRDLMSIARLVLSGEMMLTNPELETEF